MACSEKNILNNWEMVVIILIHKKKVTPENVKITTQCTEENLRKNPKCETKESNGEVSM